MTLQTNTILVHYAEIALKGRNRARFLRYLTRNVERKLKSLGLNWPVHQPYSYCYIDVPPAEAGSLDDVLTVLGDVAGVAWYAPAYYITAEDLGLFTESPDLKPVARGIIEQARDRYRPGKAFCVRVKRGEKRFPITSAEMERRLGSEIIKHSRWDSVNLTNPDEIFHASIQTEGAYVFGRRFQGMGGLPVGISGRVLTLFSGGIDSPVAAYLMAKRGAYVDFLHFTATLLQQDRAPEYKVSQLAQKLSNFTMNSRLYLVPYTHFEVAILGKETEYELILFRRFMARVAERLAGQLEAQALVTGDNLGQVASQTLENIVSNSQAVSLPILRPLLTYDKLDITYLAEEIDTFELSVIPYKDCCSILQQNPRTKSDHQTLEQIEQAVIPDYDDLIDRTLADAICLEYKCGEPLFEKEAVDPRL